MIKHLSILVLVAGLAMAGPVTISDTLTTPQGGLFSGRVIVTLEPSTASPLTNYSGVTLVGWEQSYTITNGVFNATLEANDTITPSGTYYRVQMIASNGGRRQTDTWVVPTSGTALTIGAIRGSPGLTPTTQIAPSQITAGGATSGQYLRYNGTSWAPFTLSALSDPTTTTGDIIYRSGASLVRLPIGSTGQVLKVAGGAPSWAAESGGGSGITSLGGLTGATQTFGNDTNVTMVSSGTAHTLTWSGTLADGRIASASTWNGKQDGDADLTALAALASTGLIARTASNTYALRAIAGTAGQITVANGDGVAGPPTISLPSTITGLTSVSSTGFTGALTGNVTGNVTGSSGSTTGNAATATALQTGRAINGVTFDGTSAITVTAAAGTLSGTTLNATVTGSSLTSVGTLVTGVWNATVIGSSYGGAGAVNGILKADGSGTVSAATSGVDYLTSGDVSSLGLSGDLTDATGTLAAANGGTGTGTATNDALLLGNGVSWSLAVLPSCSTGATDKLLYNSSTNAFSCGTDQGGGGSGTVTSVGWTGGIVSIATATTTPAFTIAGDSGGIPYFSSSSTWASSGALTSGAIVLGGGAGGAPTVLANSSSPNASQLWVHQTNAAASATQAALLVGPTTMSGFSANGTYVAINAQAGFSGRLIDVRVNNSVVFLVDSAAATATQFAATNAAGFYSNSNVALQFSNASSGASSVARLIGSAGTAVTNYAALRGSSTYSNDQLRVFANNPMVSIGQRATATSASNISLYVEDNTATTGVTRLSIQEGAGQSTTPGFEYRINGVSINAGTLVWSIAAGGEPTWGSTSEATCASGTRGQVVMVQGGAGVADTFRICKKDAADAYAWTALY